MRALRHPALGLVLVTLGVAALPQRFASLLVILVRDSDVLSPDLLAIMTAQLLVGVLQVAAGWAVISRRAPVLWFGAYTAACAVLVVCSTLLMHGGDFDPKVVLGICLETLGLPAIIGVASVMYRDEELEDERSPVDVIAMLLVIAVGTLTVTPLELAHIARLLVGARASAGTWAGMMLWPLLFLGLAILALVAARRFTARSLWIYVAAAIGLRIGTVLLSVIVTSFQGHAMRVELVVFQTVALASALTPITLWLYARPIPEVIAPRAPSRVPIWLALSFVPLLFGRVVLVDEMAGEWGVRASALVVAVSATMGAVILAMADAAFRRRTSARWWSLAGALAGFVALVGAAYVLLTLDTQLRAQGVLQQVGHLFAATAVAAWLYRLPRM